MDRKGTEVIGNATAIRGSGIFVGTPSPHRAVAERVWHARRNIIGQRAGGRVGDRRRDRLTVPVVRVGDQDAEVLDELGPGWEDQVAVD